LQKRYQRYLDDLLALAEKELQRTLWEKPFHELARFYLERFRSIRTYYLGCGGDLVGAFRAQQDAGRLDIITSAATHALLPLLAAHPPSLRAQILIGCDHYRQCLGRDPDGTWLPECAYVEGLEAVLKQANLKWFIINTHGLLHARPQPRYAMFAPIFTPNGIAAFARDPDSAKQVWSRQEGYPGDPRYRDFYRDIGFDLESDYLKPYLPAPAQRSFTGIKYHRITGPGNTKAVYERAAAVRAAEEHAAHFLSARTAQVQRLGEILNRPPLVLCPYDAELFGHWWFEGPEFLDFLVRKACAEPGAVRLITPGDYLRLHPTNQVAAPAASSWGDGGYWGVWLNESNHWIYPHLRVAQERMSELVNKPAAGPANDELRNRALEQAGRELLLAQASDWPFILRTGTSPDYARKRITDHLARFTKIYEMLRHGTVNETWLREVEANDNLFSDLKVRYWNEPQRS